MLANDTQARLAKARVGTWLRALLDTLFPQAAEQTYATPGDVRDALDASATELRSLLRPLEGEIDDPARIAAAFFQALPEIHRQLMVDATAIERGDPAAESVDEVILAYPGFLAIAAHRIGHRFYELRVPLLPRVLTEWAHERTGIDIHPGATLGHPVVIDHGTGIVIGETAVLGNNVKLYQGVTLGALSVTKSLASTKRHPTIEQRRCHLRQRHDPGRRDGHRRGQRHRRQHLDHVQRPAQLDRLSAQRGPRPAGPGRLRGARLRHLASFENLRRPNLRPGARPNPTRGDPRGKGQQHP